MPDEKKILLSAEHLYKKFSKDLKSSLYYGMLDVVGSLVNRSKPELRLRKHEFWAVQDLSLQVKEGEILAVIGANGSGKTTLMRLIANIYPIDYGQVILNGDYKITPIFALSAGMQPLFTGRENIFIKGAMLGMSKAQIMEKMDFIIDFFERKDFLDTPFGNYSSGMKARLAYSVAIATDPDLFIIDEALAVGDSEFKAKCYDHLKEYVKQSNKAVLFVSNSMKKVLEVATRVVVIDNGVIIFNSENIYEALTFYINNCLGPNLDERTRKIKLEKIRA
ncbi:MAG: lipopolysaccharide transport system ATP-binding protein, partial [Saprospiraceae bacterium]